MPQKRKLERPHLVVVVSGPSGAGKSTLCTEFIRDNEETSELIVTTTTRERRRGEVDGQDYNFVTVEEFQRGVSAGEFLEHALVHDHYYGSPRQAVEQSIQRGKDVILEIDVQGGLSVKKAMPSAVLVFVIPSDLRVLRQRLMGRGTDSQEVIERRLRNAKREMERLVDYQYFLFNDDRVESAVATLKTILEAERNRISRYDTHRLFNPELLESALEAAKA